MRFGLARVLVGFGFAALVCAACGSSVPTGEPPLGSSEFVSAAGSQGAPTEKNDGEYAGAPASDASGGGTRTVEEGDIYRVLGPNRLLNLNSYRGLQVIDLTDSSAPRVMGRVAVSGYPVEMYVVGNRAYVLLNDWYGYYGSRTDVAVQPYQGGLVLAIDITDPANPVITGRAQVPGNIQTSRLTRGGGMEALFVAASNWNGETKTVVRSFAVSSAGKLEERTTLDLGGYVVDVQATPEALLVARQDWSNPSPTGSLVAIINISDPNGTMVEGASVTAAGYVKSKTNMGLENGILRIASGGQWTGGGSNYVQTFNVADINNPLPIDQVNFGDGQDLYATLFIPGKAFCVTYHRVDPFHAFEISAEGLITERSQFVVSGWNDFFSAVYNDSRLVGIGVDDTNGRKLAASLYDISDLTNPSPLINRASIEFDYSWSEASWDNRAFSVLEDAVVAVAPDGTAETGLILLPFTGYSSSLSTYQAGVQIFTFSPTTLTKRGVMDHGTQVRRSFMQRDGVTANLSEQALSLYDVTVPDSPAQLGKLDLAPNYMDFYVFGSYGARLKYDNGYYSWWGTSSTALPDNQLQIIPLDGDPDTATPVATVSLPAYAQLFQVGNLAVAVTTTYVENSDPAQYSSEIRVFDLTDPTSPVERGSLTTDQIQPSYGYYYGGYYGDCWDCGYYWSYGSLEAQVAGSTLVFPSRQWNSELLGTEHICYSYPEDYGSNCWDSNGYVTGCGYYAGSITCSSLNGGSETCQGEIERCTYGADGTWSCEKVDEGSVALQTSCYDQEKRRYWSYLTLAPLVLSDPDAPAMSGTLSMPETEDDSSIVASGTSLYVTYRVPISVPGDGRDYVKYYFKTISFANPLLPAVGPSINIPGELILVDGATIYTRDYVWGQNIVESAINRLTVSGNHAYLQARRRFLDQNVDKMLLDGAGHVLVSHSLSWYADNTTGADTGTRLSILDTSGTDFPQLSQVAVDSWASFRDAKVGRALFTVPGGLLVMNVQTATAPYPQAYYALQGWPTHLVVANNDIFMPAGPYGMYRFDIDSYNLIAADQ
jgi:hypothetical protein